MTKSDDDIDDDGEMTFISLQSLQVYCVFVKVESIATDASNSSSVHCIRLPIGNINIQRLLFIYAQSKAEMCCLGPVNTYLAYQ